MLHIKYVHSYVYLFHISTYPNWGRSHQVRISEVLLYYLTDGEDYTADPRTLTFSPGMLRVCYNVAILDDNRYELNEDFFVNITTSDPQTDIIPMSAIVTIEDDEGK